MTWNYRIVKTTFDNHETRYAIHEVYYDDDGNATAHSVEPVCPSGDTLKELRADFDNYRKAMDAPVLTGHDFSFRLPKEINA